MKLIKVNTSDNLQLTGILAEAPQSKNIIIHFHGMAGDMYGNSYYPAMYEQYPQNNWSFLAVEQRGTHTITEFRKGTEVINIGNAFEKFEECIYDVSAWIDKTKEMGYTNIWIQAHSLGPSKIAYYLHQQKSTDISGVIFLSPSDILGLVHDSLGQKDHDLLYPEAKKLVNDNKGNTLLSHMLWDSVVLSAETYLNFFEDTAKTNIFNYGNPNHSWEVVNSISIPVLAFTGTKDDGIIPVIDPYEAMKKLEKELIKSPRKRTIVYKDADHDFKGFGEKIVEEVLHFISS